VYLVGANTPLTGATKTETKIRQVSLWRRSNFLRLWTSETIASFGGQFSDLAIPFTAVIVLQGTPTELGFLNAATTAPFMIFSLIAGVWVDRHRRRSIMIASNVGRAILLAMVPFAYATRLLSIPLLLTVAFLVGTLRVFFEIAYQSYLPGLVEREELVDANSRLEASRAVSSVAGPGTAGVVIQIISAPFAIAFDAISFVLSTLFLSRIKYEETIEASPTRPSILADIREGLEIVFKDARLRSVAVAASAANFFEFTIQAIFILYAVNVLGLAPLLLGVIFSIGAIGAIVGALAAGSLAHRLGVGPAIIISLALGATTWGPLMFLANRSTAVPLLIAAWFLGEISFVAWSINQSSFRQAICPPRLQGRMNATLRFLTVSSVPLGSIFGGILGEILGLRLAIGIAAFGLLLTPLLVVFSPVRKLKGLSEVDLIANP
jgi:MFS family permease